jgi:hypothetical protein
LLLSKKSQKENVVFSKDEDEKHKCTSSKGKFETDQQNDQIVKSPLKKLKKKSKQKCPIAQKVFV